MQSLRSLSMSDKDKFFEQKIFPDFPVNSLCSHQRMTGVVSETSEPFAGFVFFAYYCQLFGFYQRTLQESL